MQQPDPQREAREAESARVQVLFASKGLQVVLAEPRAQPPRYRCQTQRFEISFAAADAEFAADMATQADAIYEQVKTWFQFGLPYRVKVKIQPMGSTHAERMKEFTGLAGGKTFYLNAAENPNRHTFAHELTHLFFFRQKPDKVIPWWLNEGLAEYVATENRSDKAYLERHRREVAKQEALLALGNLPNAKLPLWQSYQAALSFFLYLHERYGEATVQEMVKGFMRSPVSTTIEDVAFSVYGKSLETLEAEWRTAVRASETR